MHIYFPSVCTTVHKYKGDLSLSKNLIHILGHHNSFPFSVVWMTI